MKNNIYFNHDNTFVDIPKKFRDEFLACQKNKLCKTNEEALAYHVITFIGRKYERY